MRAGYLLTGDRLRSPVEVSSVFRAANLAGFEPQLRAGPVAGRDFTVQDRGKVILERPTSTSGPPARGLVIRGS